MLNRSFPEELPELKPEFPHRVWVKIDGSIMSEEAQEQRDALAEWFLRSDIVEEDMDSVYTRIDGSTSGWGPLYTHMVFGFRDAKKAMLFKLAWHE